MAQIKTEQDFKDMIEEQKTQKDKSNQYVLLIYDNIDLLPQEIQRVFEKRMIDLIRENACLRLLTSSTKKYNFKEFLTVKNNNDESEQKIKYRMATMKLKPLNVNETVKLILALSQRLIRRAEVDLKEDDPDSLAKRLSLEKSVQDLGNCPKNIVNFVDKL